MDSQPQELDECAWSSSHWLPLSNRGKDGNSLSCLINPQKTYIHVCKYALKTPQKLILHI